MSALLSGQLINWKACHGLRKVHQDSGGTSFLSSTGITTRRGRFRSSQTPGDIYLVAVCASQINQTWKLRIDDGVTPVESTAMSHISSDTSATSSAFNDLAHFTTSVVLTADTDYEWSITQSFPGGAGNIRPVSSCLIYEWSPASVDTAETYVVNTQKFFSKGPIYDADLQKAIQAAHEQWKIGPQLISICSHGIQNYWATNSASYVNMLVSSASTTVSSSTPGFNLPLTYHAPYHTADIRAELWVYARQDAGTAANDVKLEDASGTLGTLSNFSNSAFEWKNTAVTLTGGASHKVDLQFRCDGTNELRVGAVSLYVRET